MVCAGARSTTHDDWLLRSVQELKTKHPDVKFQSDSQPCEHARETVNAFTATLDHNYLKRFDGYQFAKILTQNGYFTVERFTIPDPESMRLLNQALAKRHSRKLQIEANTKYDYFILGNSIVFMVSSAVGSDQNTIMFRELQQDFTSLAKSEK